MLMKPDKKVSEWLEIKVDYLHYGCGDSLSGHNGQLSIAFKGREKEDNIFSRNSDLGQTWNPEFDTYW